MTGVSTQTVSRVINKRPDVSPETRRAVEAAIAEHGFQPSAVARSLVQRRSQMLGVIVAGLKYYGVAQTINGMAEATEAAGYSIILKELASFDVPDIVPVVDFFVAHRVEGIVFAPPQMGANVRHLQEQLPPSTPPVIFLKAEPSDRFTSIGIDNLDAARIATRHLLALGRKRVAHIAGPLEWREARDRRDGWLAALDGGGPGARAHGGRRLDVGERRHRVRADPGRGPRHRRAVRRQRPDGPGRPARRPPPRDPHPRAARGRGLRRDPGGRPSSPRRSPPCASRCRRSASSPSGSSSPRSTPRPRRWRARSSSPPRWCWARAPRCPPPPRDGRRGRAVDGARRPAAAPCPPAHPERRAPGATRRGRRPPRSRRRRPGAPAARTSGAGGPSRPRPPGPASGHGPAPRA